MWRRLPQSILRHVARSQAPLISRARPDPSPAYHGLAGHKQCFIRRSSTMDSAMKYEINLKQKGADEEPVADSNDWADDDEEDYYERKHPLQSQLEHVPANALSLRIIEDVPTDAEWTILGSHLNNVENLEVEAGFDESLNDRLTPVHWPLKRLLLSSSCGELIQNPHILLGTVEHLIFFMTMGIRFEGPTSDELSAAHSKAVKEGTKDEHSVSESGLRFVYRPRLVSDWMQAKYDGIELELPSGTANLNPDVYHKPDSSAVNGDAIIALTKLEFLENDAVETFIRFALALPRLAYNLRTLNIRSTNGCDLNHIAEEIFGEQLVNMDQLEHLSLTLGGVFRDQSTLATLYKSLPSGLHTLKFRGPVSLPEHAEWDAWVNKFGDPSFLPNLEKLSFVCDLAYGPRSETYDQLQTRKATKDELRQAKQKCEQLVAAVRNRNLVDGKKVQIEPFVELWNEEHSYMTAVDPAWYDV